MRAVLLILALGISTVMLSGLMGRPDPVSPGLAAGRPDPVSPSLAAGRPDSVSPGLAAGRPGPAFPGLAAGWPEPAPPCPTARRLSDYFRVHAAVFAGSVQQLRSAIGRLNTARPMAAADARRALLKCRLEYKRIEFILEYFFKSAASVYNHPPKYEVEEPDMEYQTPIGFQVIEALLFDSHAAAEKGLLLQQADALCASATDLSSLLYGFQPEDAQVLESIRLEWIRVIALGITGYDAPLLKSGIRESAAALASLRYALAPYIPRNGAPGLSGERDSLTLYLEKSRAFLAAHPGFDAFDRLTFLIQDALPLERQINTLIERMHLVVNTSGGALNYRARDLFSPDALAIDAFPRGGGYTGRDRVPGEEQPGREDVSRGEYPGRDRVPGGDGALARLGRRLFFEQALSGNRRLSCATCHIPDRHFTDGLARSKGFDGKTPVHRNAPTLLYAGFQYGQFWDGRAVSLEDQVRAVVENPEEMGGDSTRIAAALNAGPAYRSLFRQAFPAAGDSGITFGKIAASLAAYVRTLNPRTSRFDRFMEGKNRALTAAEKRGFNVFMGKGQCATCHFAPLFNGLTPPLYNTSEVEVLGVPATDRLDRPVPDTDKGRYAFFPIRFYEGAFKTPTVRNASATAPYMHNGAFATLDKVVAFYNKGGGKGLKLDIPEQTLSEKPLQLTPSETADLIRFLGALEDPISKEFK